MRFKAIDIANFYIQLANSLSDNSVDNLKINKLLYYAQGFSLAKLGAPIFEDDIQAWDYGPVIPDVYHAFKCCGKKSIDEPTDEFDESCLNSEELNLLIDVYTSYGKYTGWALKNMTHVQGSPWAMVYEPGKNRVISLDSMKEYFAGEKLDTFNIDDINIPVVSELPKEWDSAEDGIYD